MIDVGTGLGQVGRDVLGQRAVDGEQVAQDQAEGPAVVHQVVFGLKQPVVVRGQPDEGPPHHGRLGGVEGFIVLFAPEFLEGEILVLGLGQVQGAVAGFACVVHPLLGWEVLGVEFEAERLVAGEHGGETLPQGQLVERPVQVEGGGEVVGAAVGEEFLVQPDDLLGTGEVDHRRGPFRGSGIAASGPCRTVTDAFSVSRWGGGDGVAEEELQAVAVEPLRAGASVVGSVGVG